MVSRRADELAAMSVSSCTRPVAPPMCNCSSTSPPRLDETAVTIAVAMLCSLVISPKVGESAEEHGRSALSGDSGNTGCGSMAEEGR